jgi:Putative pectate lyase-like adhesive domain
VGKRVVGAVVAMGALAGASLVVLGAGPAAATTVTDEASFRAAWTNASETSIELANDISLTNCGAGEPTRSSATPLTLTGNGHTIAQTCAGQRVLSQLGGGALSFDAVTITGGNIAAGFGGGINTNSGVTLNNSTVTGNTAGTSGGGLSVVGPVTITNSTVSGNTAGPGVGGGMLVNGTVTVTNSTFSGNHSGGASGGIHANPGPVTLTNSTVTDNSSDCCGGGITAVQGLTLVYSTVVRNTAPDGANVFVEFPGHLTSFASVVALPQGGGLNCTMSGTTTSNGFNFSDDASCGFTAATDKQSAGDPGLGALADNGGPTLTRLPQTGSPLIDAIPSASCQADGASGITTDQRGVSRPQGGGCDIGAVEVAGVTPPPPTTTGPGAAVPVTAVVRFTG